MELRECCMGAQTEFNINFWQAYGRKKIELILNCF